MNRYVKSALVLHYMRRSAFCILMSLCSMYHAMNANAAAPSYQDFLDAIRTFESDIDPAKADYYAKHYLTPDFINYQQVSSPGRTVRGDDGNPLMSKTSIQLYTPGSTDPKMFKIMQYSATNFIGFIGYQFSERDLWDLGYYVNYDEYGREKYYSDIGDANWAHGVRDKIVNNTHITDVNTWTGRFSGKNGILTMTDFKDPEKQDYIAKDHFSNKYDGIVTLLEKQGKKIADYLGTSLNWDDCTPKISPPPGGRSNTVTITMSGLLAGAHLRGAEGVVALLVNHENHADEVGTTILQYVQDFGGYQTPFVNGSSLAVTR